MSNYFDHSLFLFDSLDDAALNQLYSTATCLIAASYAEGFGLPLIEAAQRGLPLFVRDIPVFREVANDHAYFFNNDPDYDISPDIRKWMVMYESDAHPKSTGVTWMTWEQSVKNLVDLVTDTSDGAVSSMA